MGFYKRPVINEQGTLYKNFLIARFECCRKGSNVVVQDRTFSLLPYKLIPYSKYSIPFIIKIFEMNQIEGKSITKIQELLSLFNDDPEKYIDLAQSTIFDLKKTILQVINKLLAVDYYQDFKEICVQLIDDNKLIAAFINFAQSFICYKLFHSIRGPCILGYDFYLTGGSYIKNSHFLFGTPSQFRIN